MTAGTMVTVRWETQNARRVTLEHVGKGALSIDSSAAAGMIDVAINADSTFVLTAQGEGGTDNSGKVTNLLV